MMSNFKIPGSSSMSERKTNSRSGSISSTKKDSVAKDYFGRRTSVEVSTPAARSQGFKLAQHTYMKKYLNLSSHNEKNPSIPKTSSMIDLSKVNHFKNGLGLQSSSVRPSRSSCIYEYETNSKEPNYKWIKSFHEINNNSFIEDSVKSRKSNEHNSTFEIPDRENKETSFDRALDIAKRMDTSINLDLSSDEEDCNDVLRSAPNISRSAFSDIEPFLGFNDSNKSRDKAASRYMSNVNTSSFSELVPVFGENNGNYSDRSCRVSLINFDDVSLSSSSELLEPSRPNSSDLPSATIQGLNNDSDVSLIEGSPLNEGKSSKRLSSFSSNKTPVSGKSKSKYDSPLSHSSTFGDGFRTNDGLDSVYNQTRKIPKSSAPVKSEHSSAFSQISNSIGKLSPSCTRDLKNLQAGKSRAQLPIKTSNSEGKFEFNRINRGDATSSSCELQFSESHTSINIKNKSKTNQNGQGLSVEKTLEEQRSGVNKNSSHRPKSFKFSLFSPLSREDHNVNEQRGSYSKSKNKLKTGSKEYTSCGNAIKLNVEGNPHDSPVVKPVAQVAGTVRKSQQISNPSIRSPDCNFRPISRAPFDTSRASSNRATDTSSVVELTEIFNKSQETSKQKGQTKKLSTPFSDTYIEAGFGPNKAHSATLVGDIDSSPKDLPDKNSIKINTSLGGSSLSSTFLSPSYSQSQNLNFTRIVNTDANNVTLDCNKKNASPVAIIVAKPSKTYTRKPNKNTLIKVSHEWFQTNGASKKRNITNKYKRLNKKKLFDLTSNYNKESSVGSADSVLKEETCSHNAKQIEKPSNIVTPSIYSIDDFINEPIQENKRKRMSRKSAKKSTLKFDFDINKLNDNSEDEFTLSKKYSGNNLTKTNVRRSSRNKRQINYKEISESEGDRSRLGTPCEVRSNRSSSALSDRTKMIKQIILNSAANEIPEKHQNIPLDKKTHSRIVEVNTDAEENNQINLFQTCSSVSNENNGHRVNAKKSYSCSKDLNIDAKNVKTTGIKPLGVTLKDSVRNKKSRESDFIDFDAIETVNDKEPTPTNVEILNKATCDGYRQNCFYSPSSIQLMSERKLNSPQGAKIQVARVQAIVHSAYKRPLALKNDSVAERTSNYSVSSLPGVQDNGIKDGHCDSTDLQDHHSTIIPDNVMGDKKKSNKRLDKELVSNNPSKKIRLRNYIKTILIDLNKVVDEYIQEDSNE